jgi:hypothetical protein
MFILPIGLLHMHRQIITSHNLVTKIKNILTHIKIDTPMTFCADMLSMITYRAGSVQMTYKPIHYVHLNPFPV